MDENSFEERMGWYKDGEDSIDEEYEKKKKKKKKIPEGE